MREGWGWAGEAVQVGTNDRMWEEGATKEEVDLKLNGRPYGAKFGSIRYYRVPPKADAHA